MASRSHCSLLTTCSEIFVVLLLLSVNPVVSVSSLLRDEGERSLSLEDSSPQMWSFRSKPPAHLVLALEAELGKQRRQCTSLTPSEAP